MKQDELEREIAATETWKRAARNGMLIEGCPVTFNSGREYGVAWCLPEEGAAVLCSRGEIPWPEDCAPRIGPAATLGALLGVVQHELDEPRSAPFFDRYSQRWRLSYIEARNDRPPLAAIARRLVRSQVSGDIEGESVAALYLAIFQAIDQRVAPGLEP